MEKSISKSYFSPPFDVIHFNWEICRLKEHENNPKGKNILTKPTWLEKDSAILLCLLLFQNKSLFFCCCIHFRIKRQFTSAGKFNDVQKQKENFKPIKASSQQFFFFSTKFSLTLPTKTQPPSPPVSKSMERKNFGVKFRTLCT
jgi:hypothetical protein